MGVKAFFFSILYYFCNIHITVIFVLHGSIKLMGIRKLKNDIGKKIKALRTDRGLSQEKLAENVNLSREHISCIERGKNLASIETLYNIANYFEIDIKYFF